MTLVHKGGYKTKDELKNYRPIALADTVGKIFCSILNERLSAMIEQLGVIGEEQNGFRKDRRAEDNIYVINEMIERKKRDGDRVYMAFLDIEKAYDRVNREQLCRVLESVGVSEQMVRIVRSMYASMRAKYRLGVIETDWVYTRRGVRQGCILSPLLFGLYTEELAARMRQLDAGVKSGQDRLRMLLYADDALVMSEDANELQQMLDVVTLYGRDFDVKFGMDKSKVLIINKGEDDAERVWTLGGNTMSQTTRYNYLGVWVNEQGCEGTKDDRIGRANQWMGRLASVARVRASKYEVLREVWKSVAVPSLMYAWSMDVIPWSNSELEQMEVTQRKVARLSLIHI